MFRLLIQREEGNTAFRDIGAEMERELLNYLGDVPVLSQGEVSMTAQRRILCLFKFGCVVFLLVVCFRL